MVAVLLYLVYKSNTDLGFGEETIAYTSRVQHHMGLDFMYGTSTAFGINICMSEQYLLPMARNTVTGQTVKNQDLTGTKFTQRQRVLAEDIAAQLADRMTARTGDTWLGFVRLYTPTVRS
jgi:hypothetical protein